jgi:protein-S-isoprenylcysteine O-methyltransferase Ste14
VPLWIRVIVATVLLPGMIAGYIPLRIGTGGSRWPLVTGPIRWIAPLFLVVGLALLVTTIWQFARSGEGTLAPWDAPTRLVDRSLYGWVRNPMYLGVLATILGQACWWQSGWVFVYGACVALAFHLRVILFEEPALRRLFGSAFEAYAARVPRWIPRRPRPHN